MKKSADMRTFASNRIAAFENDAPYAEHLVEAPIRESHRLRLR